MWMRRLGMWIAADSLPGGIGIHGSPRTPGFQATEFFIARSAGDFIRRFTCTTLRSFTTAIMADHTGGILVATFTRGIQVRITGHTPSGTVTVQESLRMRITDLEEACTTAMGLVRTAVEGFMVAVGCMVEEAAADINLGSDRNGSKAKGAQRQKRPPQRRALQLRLGSTKSSMSDIKRYDGSRPGATF